MIRVQLKQHIQQLGNDSRFIAVILNPMDKIRKWVPVISMESNIVQKTFSIGELPRFDEPANEGQVGMKIRLEGEH